MEAIKASGIWNYERATLPQLERLMAQALIYQKQTEWPQVGRLIEHIQNMMETKDDGRKDARK